MSTFKVTVEHLTIYPHPNADKLELAEVGLYRAVVGKGQFATGDYAIYIPEQAVLPFDLIEELGLVGKLAGPLKDRVKAVRLRGELSQGIVCQPIQLSDLWELETAGFGELKEDVDTSVDFAEELGITKWVPPVPVGMAGEVQAAPDLLRWSDIENIKRYPDIFQQGEGVVATEKIHGTCCLVTYVAATGEVLVSSKGQGSKSLSLKPSGTNLYWRAVVQHELGDLAAALCDHYRADRIGLFGEVYGEGVQDLTYGKAATKIDTIGYALFDIAVEAKGEVEFIDAELIDLAVNNLKNRRLKIPTLAPVLYRGPYDYETLAALTSGKETLSGESLHVREGIVVRPSYERRCAVTGGRAIAKFVSDDYILRGGTATEYE